MSGPGCSGQAEHRRSGAGRVLADESVGGASLELGGADPAVPVLIEAPGADGQDLILTWASRNSRAYSACSMKPSPSMSIASATISNSQLSCCR
jgi:hypothetical protein